MPESIVLTSPEQACDLVRSHARMSIRGGGTKPGLWASTDDAVQLDTRGLSGIIEYEPDEYVFTARTGTTLRELTDTLNKAGQYLPFDPLFVEQGSTLGGCIASGISGPGRFRFGGVRDFIIGVRFIDGSGNLIKGGGKVVKNAAGFEFPKLMVGSLGRLGLITEASFKVFPKPEAVLVAATDAPSVTDAVKIIANVAMKPFDLDAIEYANGKVFVRIAGNEVALKARLEAIRKATGLAFDTTSDLPNITGNVRVPISLPQLAALDAELAKLDVQRSYSVAGNVAWISWPGDRELAALDGMLNTLNQGAQHLDAAPARIGRNVAVDAERVV
jgi:glycolate oxidase FAD binding subunit